MKLGERYRDYKHQRQLDRERRVIGRDNLVVLLDHAKF